MKAAEEIDSATLELISWVQAMRFARSHDIVAEIVGALKYAGRDEECVILRFAGGEVIVATSNYDADYSSWTPGDGIQAPTCYISKEHAKAVKKR